MRTGSLTSTSLRHLAAFSVTSKVVDIIRNPTRLLETQHMYIISQSTLRGFMAAFFVAGFGLSLSAEQSRPNVLLILSDDHSVPVGSKNSAEL